MRHKEDYGKKTIRPVSADFKGGSYINNVDRLKEDLARKVAADPAAFGVHGHLQGGIDSDRMRAMASEGGAR